MQVILLSGGSGKRLWPLSNDIRSKQFIKIFKNPNGGYESMLQRAFRQIKKVDANISIVVATAKSQVSMVRNHLGAVDISAEPCRRDTFPAVALTCAYLRDVKKINPDEPIVVCPVDSYVEDKYFLLLRKMAEMVAAGNINLALMGIKPTYPSSKYGYIIPAENNLWVFKEKPTEQIAAEYIAKGALWNGGIFAFKLGYILDKTKSIIGKNSYAEIFAQYETLPKISFDYAISEKEKNIAVAIYDGEWKDSGTWNTLSEVMEIPCIGDVLTDNTCTNLNVINETDIPLICMGLKDMIVAAGADGILVTDKIQSAQIKSYVEQIHQPSRYAEKSWGVFKIIDIEQESLTIKADIPAGQHMRYHSHNFRAETWNIISGEGTAIVDGKKLSVRAGDVVNLPVNCRHTIIAKTNLKIIEVQLGKDITIDDKIIYDFPEGVN